MYRKSYSSDKPKVSNLHINKGGPPINRLAFNEPGQRPFLLNRIASSSTVSDLNTTPTKKQKNHSYLVFPSAASSETRLTKHERCCTKEIKRTAQTAFSLTSKIFRAKRYTSSWPRQVGKKGNILTARTYPGGTSWQNTLQVNEAIVRVPQPLHHGEVQPSNIAFPTHLRTLRVQLLFQYSFFWVS